MQLGDAPGRNWKTKRTLYSLLLTMKGGSLNQINAGWVGRRVGKAFSIPDSQGQVCSNKLSFMVSFIGRW